MKSNVKAGEIANLFSAFRDSNNSSRTFTPLQKKFCTDITAVALTFPHFWQDDFIQEGNLGLYNAALKYPIDAKPSQFYFYALHAIRTKMLDFYQSVIGRTMTDVTVFDDEGQSTTFKQPIFQETERYFLEDDEKYNILDTAVSPVDYVTSSSLSIDLKYLLSEKSMKNNNLSEKEIKVFDLHFNKGYNVSEVAGKISQSVSQASKIISKTKIKLQQLLAYTSNNTLN